MLPGYLVGCCILLLTSGEMLQSDFKFSLKFMIWFVLVKGKVCVDEMYDSFEVQLRGDFQFPFDKPL